MGWEKSRKKKKQKKLDIYSHDLTISLSRGKRIAILLENKSFGDKIYGTVQKQSLY
jgi:hypothetical protein